MRVDQCGWEAARKRVEEINKENDKKAGLAQLPYRLGVTLGFCSVLSIPLVFHRDTVLWFAENIANYPGNF